MIYEKVFISITGRRAFVKINLMETLATQKVSIVLSMKLNHGSTGKNIAKIN
jgi:hypothetical protein